MLRIDRIQAMRSLQPPGFVRAVVVDLVGGGGGFLQFRVDGNAVVEHEALALPVGLGVGQGISVIEMCELIKELTGYKGEIKLDPTKPDGAAYKTVDGTLGEKMLGWKPQVPFNEGVAQAIQWYEENH